MYGAVCCQINSQQEFAQMLARCRKVEYGMISILNDTIKNTIILKRTKGIAANLQTLNNKYDSDLLYVFESSVIDTRTRNLSNM